MTEETDTTLEQLTATVEQVIVWLEEEPRRAKTIDLHGDMRAAGALTPEMTNLARNEWDWVESAARMMFTAAREKSA